MEKVTIFLAMILMMTSVVSAEVVLKEVEYDHDGQALVGYLAYDPAIIDGMGPRPGVMIIHDWDGIDEYEKGRAKQLAELGYVAFACDIYGKGNDAGEPGKAGEWAGKFRNNDRTLFRARANRGLEFLKEQPQSDDEKIAAIGYCFGGTGVLELARSGAELEGVVSFHGGLGTPNPEDGKNIKTPVLVCHGDDDPHVPESEVDAFLKEMKDGDVDYQFVAYADAVHSFTKVKAGNDPSKGSAYNEKADKRSWEHMQVFFDEVLK